MLAIVGATPRPWRAAGDRYALAHRNSSKWISVIRFSVQPDTDNYYPYLGDVRYPIEALGSDGVAPTGARR
jgi:hypothetical protein